MLIQVVAFVMLLAQGPSTASKSSEIVGHRDPAAYAKAWQGISDAVTTHYYARKTRKAEMDQLLAKYKPLAEGAKDDLEFEAQVETMIHDFGDSHFDLYTKSDQGYYVMDGLQRADRAEQAPEIGAWFKLTSEGYVVQMVLENTQASKMGIRPGDRILSADDAPFGPISSFIDKVDKPVNLVIQRGDEKIEKSVIPQSEQLMGMFLTATRDSARTIEAGGKKIGYVHLWTQANDTFRSTLENLVTGRFAETDAFILDLRDGFGGRPERFADVFFRPDAQISWDYGTTKSTQHFGYGKPLVVLINGGSRSAKELLSYILKSSKRATLIGTTTAGNVLGTSPNRINDWAILELPMVDVSVDGIRLEKNGVQPNIKVPDGFDKDGQDVVIERAVEFLTSHKR